MGFGSQVLFGKYCEKFEGPLYGQMYAEFTKNGLRWWTYDVAIEGRLVLRYAKNDQPGEAVRVNGELVGVATGFKMRENAAEVLFPDVMVGKQVVYRRSSPLSDGRTTTWKARSWRRAAPTPSESRSRES